MQKDISIPMENFACSKMEHPFKWIFSKHWNWKFLYYYWKICRGPDRTSKRAAVCPSLLYMFRAVSLPVIWNSRTVHTACGMCQACLMLPLA